ncbi:MAG TPA: hypothetical protein VKN63_10155 [Afifellaceae bacterium]|jgi:mannose/fructose/N-acetylgalactosamine-specific phosphotransferase system component IIC|nr:hypothetical protein [Afifellaceae bacterium]
MKGFLAGVAGIIVISVGAAVVLNMMDASSQMRYTSEHGSVRLGE